MAKPKRSTEPALKPGAHVHIMGIGGAGMSAIAQLMQAQGYMVTGCDATESPVTANLKEKGVDVLIGHDIAHVQRFKTDMLAISSAIPGDHPEVEGALVQGVPVFKRSDIMAALMQHKTGIAVAGTHGKTTTTAMIAHILQQAGLDPSYIIGGVPLGGMSAKAGSGQAFVVEADEYDRMFLGLRPRITVLTTLEMDHPDMFRSMNEVRELFTTFLDMLPEDGLLIASHDWEETRKLAVRRQVQGRPALTYGLEGGLWQAENIEAGPERITFLVKRLGFEAAEVRLRLPGRHNVENAVAAIAAAYEMGVDPETSAEALESFRGVGRRFEVRGQINGVTIIDDYGHHPTAIRATLEAARERFPQGEIWAVWQPHTFSRTRVLLDDFTTCFTKADYLIITDVYRSRDKDTFGINPTELASRIKQPKAFHISSFDEIVDRLMFSTGPGSVVIVFSAGDATTISERLFKRLGSIEA